MTNGRKIADSLALLTLSTLFAVGATAGLAHIADSNNWCCVHSWAMAHGSGLVVLLLFGLVGYHIFAAVGTRLNLLTRKSRLGWLPNLAYLSSALGTLFFTGFFMWIGLVTSAAAILGRIRGRVVQPFGLVLVAAFVSSLSFAYWLYIQWIISSTR